MNNSKICFAAVAALTFAVSPVNAADVSPLITSIVVRDNQTFLTWTNGRPTYQAGGGIGTSPGSVSLTFPQAMSRDYPLVTLVSMIAPSPDWFAGVDSLSMITNSNWATNLVVTLYGYDAGTDSGPSYTSPDQVTVPRGAVRRFDGFPALQAGIIVPFGTFVFTRLD